MVEENHPGLSVMRQCELVSISRSAFYYEPTGEGPFNLALMREIDEVFMDCPFYGTRQMTRHLRRLGHLVGRKRVAPADGYDGAGADLPEAQSQHPQSPARGLQVSAERPGDHPPQSCLSPCPRASCT
jgi:putative transposase